ncbi:MAG TPA: hypothetical protein VGV36_06295 [Solirubrobacteraceae bacterium]|nr:hypothetical protein [Solirubrobacteraceae bacterium]
MTILHRSLVSIPAALAALALGACGGGTEGGIPDSRADALIEDLDQVASAVSSARCDDAAAQVQSFSDRVVELPDSVDTELVTRLQEGAGLLQEQAATECEKTRSETEAEEEEPPPVQEEEAPTIEQPAPEEEPEEVEPVEPPEPADPPPTPEPPPPPEPEEDPGNGNDGGGGSSGGTTPPGVIPPPRLEAGP